MSGTILIEVSPGELLDKISILEIKLERISDPDKLANVRNEMALLAAVRESRIPASEAVDRLYARLKIANEVIWEAEEHIRQEEREKRFGARFVEVARSVYFTNDERAAIKKEINLLLGSQIFEEKSHADYA